MHRDAAITSPELPSRLTGGPAAARPALVEAGPRGRSVGSGRPAPQPSQWFAEECVRL